MCGQQKGAASESLPRRRFSVADQSEHFTAKPPLKKKVFVQYLFGGPGGIRTLDLSDANRTLSQLSYGPLCYCGTLRLPQNADLLRRCRTIDGNPLTDFIISSHSEKIKIFCGFLFRTLVSARLGARAPHGRGEPYFLFGGNMKYTLHVTTFGRRTARWGIV